MFTRPFKASRKNRSRNLTLTQLESRDVPAFWTLQMLSNAVGEPGDTAATHSGTLQMYAVTVEAPTPGAAVAGALDGSIHVEFGGNTYDYPFPSNAYNIVDNWNQVTVEFEDLAAVPALCDWDYDDRYWLISVSANGPVYLPPIETPPVESPPTVPGVPPTTPPTTPPTVPGVPPTTPPTVPGVPPTSPPTVPGVPPTVPGVPPTTPPTIPPTSPMSVALSGYNGIEGTQEGRFTIARYGDLNQPLSITFEIGGTAIEGEDYAMVIRSVTFDPGEAAADVLILNWDDEIADDAETVSLTLDPIAGVSVIGSPECTISIADSPTGVPPTTPPIPPVPPPLTSIGNLVWHDTDHNGMQDEGESGIEGVVVELYRAPAGYLGELVQSTVTRPC